MPQAAVEERSCDTFRARTIRWALHGYSCYYESTRNTLIGARFFNDSPSFCDNTSFTVDYGEVPPLDSCAPVDRPATCVPDGGVSDGGGIDGGVPDAPQDTASGSDAVCRGGQADAQSPVPAACPLSFPGTTCLRSAVVANFSAIVYEQQCEGYRRRNYGFGTFALNCYYDPTALTLVAAEYFDDVPRFCGASYGINYGVTPPSGVCQTAVKVDQPCGADASAD